MVPRFLPGAHPIASPNASLRLDLWSSKPASNSGKIYSRGLLSPTISGPVHLGGTGENDAEAPRVTKLLWQPCARKRVAKVIPVISPLPFKPAVDIGPDR